MYLIISIVNILLISSITASPFSNFLGDNEILKIQERMFLITIDGFRYDYIQTYNMKNFKRLQNHGSSALNMYPQFPALTLPNYWSMITGVKVEKHGIISNTFYDPITNKFFKKEDSNYTNLSLWSNFEPIWDTSVKNGLKTAVLFWPNSDNLIFNPLQKYNNSQNVKNKNLTEKIDLAIDFFINEKFKFCILYHNQPSLVSFKYGINSYRFKYILKKFYFFLLH
jgi:predicted AlkP superfamily pyrophosphatase or phosphodiesterase